MFMHPEIATQVAAALDLGLRGVTVQQVVDAADSVLLPAMAPQEIYALVAFLRHERRQVWVGHIVESRLRGSGAELAQRGAFGHPQDVPQHGEVPGEAGWG